MAKVQYNFPVESVHGKTHKREQGYHYTTKTGKTFYREREETYQKNQSPRQKWNSAAFAYAHKQLHLIESDPATLAQMNADWEAANHLDAQGRLQQTAHSWKFNMLIAEYKSTHPFA
ncbi:MAG: hypothetical protein MJZ75_01675 [Paludibacteraceae bacterium]|nr:hypothetical protein [Paludibacteraceae bacterium]